MAVGQWPVLVPGALVRRALAREFFGRDDSYWQIVLFEVLSGCDILAVANCFQTPVRVVARRVFFVSCPLWSYLLAGGGLQAVPVFGAQSR